MFRTAVVLLALASLVAGPACCSEDFKDVPKNHWAADSIRMLSESGIVRGYPDLTFRGDSPVTRYEMAVALAAMMQYIRSSFQPVLGKKSDDPTRNRPASPETGMGTDSIRFANGDKPVTTQELAALLAAVSTKLIEERVPTAATAEASAH